MKPTYTNVFHAETKKTDAGAITILTHPEGLSHGSQFPCKEGTIIACKKYREDQTYDKVHIIINSEGELTECYQDEGIMPVFFQSPDGAIWVSITIYHPDKDLDVVLPLFDRSDTPALKPNKSISMNYIGTTSSAALFLHQYWFSSTKPDKLIALKFRGKELKSRKTFKLEMPSQNEAYVYQDEIHLVANSDKGKGLLHRNVNEKGEVLQSRKLHFDKPYHFCKTLHASFNEPSRFMAVRIDRNEDRVRSHINILEVDVQGEVKENALFYLDIRLYNVWNQITLASNTALFRFTHESGNGWLVIQEDQVVECFIHDEETGYRDVISNTFIDLGHKSLVLAAVTKTSENRYAAVFYPKLEGKKYASEMIILNRAIGIREVIQ